MIKMILAGAASAVVVGVVALKSDMACQYSPVDISWANSCENIQQVTPLAVVSVDVGETDTKKSDAEQKITDKKTAVNESKKNEPANSEITSKTTVVADKASIKSDGIKSLTGNDFVTNKAPSIDIARVEPDGSTLVAGRGAPLSKIILKNADKVIGETMSNATGEWVIIADNPIVSDSATLSLLAILPNGKSIESPNELMISLQDSGKVETKPDMVVVVESAKKITLLAENTLADTTAVLENVEKDAMKNVVNYKTVEAIKNTVSKIEKLATDKLATKASIELIKTTVKLPVTTLIELATAEAEAEETPVEDVALTKVEVTPLAVVKETEVKANVTTSATKNDVVVQKVTELPDDKVVPTKVKQVTQPLVVLTEKGKGSKVLQGAGVGKKNNKMTFNNLDFNTNGEVIFSGDAKAGEIVRVYVNNKFAGEAKADENGRWSLDQSYIMMAGGNSMRFDQVNEKGVVVSRRETKITMPKMNQKAALAAIAAAKLAKIVEIRASKDAAKTVKETVVLIAANNPANNDKKTALKNVNKTIKKSIATNNDNTPQATDTNGDLKQNMVAVKVSNKSTANKSGDDKKMVATETAQAQETMVEASNDKITAAAEDAVENTAEDAMKNAVSNPKKVRAIIIWGDNLWNISRKIYGKGELYTTIFKANTNQIRDPNLIYPGQVFILPENVEIQ